MPGGNNLAQLMASELRNQEPKGTLCASRSGIMVLLLDPAWPVRRGFSGKRKALCPAIGVLS